MRHDVVGYNSPLFVSYHLSSLLVWGGYLSSYFSLTPTPHPLLPSLAFILLSLSAHLFPWVRERIRSKGKKEEVGGCWCGKGWADKGNEKQRLINHGPYLYLRSLLSWGAKITMIKGLVYNRVFVSRYPLSQAHARSFTTRPFIINFPYLSPFTFTRAPFVER